MLEGEAWALWLALKFAMNMCLTEVYFESDCKTLVDKVNSNNLDLSKAGVLIQESRKLLLLNQIYHLVFVKRQASNVVAQSLARVATSISCLQYFHHVLML